MTSQLADIPLVNQSYGGEVRPTAALRGLKQPTSRRSVLRGMALSALTVGALSLTWGNSGRAMAETGPNGLTGWDSNDCKDAYPVRDGFPNGGYDEGPDTGGEFNGSAACFGGEEMSSEYCDANGWYRSDEKQEGDTVTKYTPVSTSCGTEQAGFKNAWKWKTPDGKVYRCSDGSMTVTVDGEETRNVFSICRALVS
ncbi:hypothetical protein ABZW18_06130 [Streptomyces sp. NPDC004647]|uniref:hypothetical protein n=1 Tax=Streptomyces sp. NPDC004647 TaxID=3154671 RepID=UPI00339E5643